MFIKNTAHTREGTSPSQVCSLLYHMIDNWNIFHENEFRHAEVKMTAYLSEIIFVTHPVIYLRFRVTNG